MHRGECIAGAEAGRGAEQLRRTFEERIEVAGESRSQRIPRAAHRRDRIGDGRDEAANEQSLQKAKGHSRGIAGFDPEGGRHRERERFIGDGQDPADGCSSIAKATNPTSSCRASAVTEAVQRKSCSEPDPKAPIRSSAIPKSTGSDQRSPRESAPPRRPPIPSPSMKTVTTIVTDSELVP